MVQRLAEEIPPGAFFVLEGRAGNLFLQM